LNKNLQKPYPGEKIRIMCVDVLVFTGSLAILYKLFTLELDYSSQDELLDYLQEIYDGMCFCTEEDIQGDLTPCSSMSEQNATAHDPVEAQLKSPPALMKEVVIPSSKVESVEVVPSEQAQKIKDALKDFIEILKASKHEKIIKSWIPSNLLPCSCTEPRGIEVVGVNENEISQAKISTGEKQIHQSWFLKAHEREKSPSEIDTSETQKQNEVQTQDGSGVQSKHEGENLETISINNEAVTDSLIPSNSISCMAPPIDTSPTQKSNEVQSQDGSGVQLKHKGEDLETISINNEAVTDSLIPSNSISCVAPQIDTSPTQKSNEVQSQDGSGVQSKHEGEDLEKSSINNEAVTDSLIPSDSISCVAPQIDTSPSQKHNEVQSQDGSGVQSKHEGEDLEKSSINNEAVTDSLIPSDSISCVAPQIDTSPSQKHNEVQSQDGSGVQLKHKGEDLETISINNEAVTDSLIPSNSISCMASRIDTSPTQKHNEDQTQDGFGVQLKHKGEDLETISINNEAVTDSLIPSNSISCMTPQNTLQSQNDINDKQKQSTIQTQDLSRVQKECE
jgi:hypothetical protein